MSNQVVPESRSIEYEVNGENVKLSPEIIRNYLVSGNAAVTDQEVVMFLNLCRFQRLNPFLNEAYLVKFKSKNGPDKPAQIIVSKEAFMKRAESHPQYNGLEAGIIVNRDNTLVEIEGAVKLPQDKLVGGWAKVYRKDRDKPVVIKISEAEFNKKQSTWNAMPLNMMRKTAVVNALREAFPDKLGAMYTEEDAQSQSFEMSAEQELQQEIEQKANKKAIDFEEPEIIDPPEKQKVNVEEKQEALFDNLVDVTEEPKKRQRDF